MAQARRWRAFALIVPLLALLWAFPTCSMAALERAPKWQELSSAQKQFLSPIQSEWNTLEASRRVKWVGIADRYPKMTPDEQARVSARLQAWIKLTPEQRKKAREAYKRLGKLPGDQRPVLAHKWEEYLALPPDEKARLRTPPPRPLGDKLAGHANKPIPPEWLVPPYLRPTASLAPPHVRH